MSVAAVLGTAVWVGNMVPVFAADQPEEELAEVQVTGSRIQRSDFNTPNPVTTIGAEELERLGINNISDAITQVPQNVSQFTPANTGGSAFYVGSTLANLRGLNPFFGTRTLTLVDSRRFIPTTQGDAVDLNFVPSNLVSRIETVTGGASAAYGSGAISGVVNIILDKRLQGVKLDADYGLTQEGDGDNTRVGLAGGTAFADGRGHVVVGGEYQKMSAIQSCADARGWCSEGRGLYTNTTGFFGGAGVPFTPNIPGQPHYMVVSGLRENQLSRAGVIYKSTPGATSTMQFDSAGTGVTPFAIGQQGWRSNAGQVVGGDGAPAYTNQTLQPSVERKTFFSHGEFDLTEAVTGYVEASWGQVEGRNNQFQPGNTANCIKQDNAFLGTLSAAARTALQAGYNNGPFATFPNEVCGDFTGGALPFLNATVLSKDWNGQNDQVVTTDTKVARAVLGLNGRFGGDWSWDVYYQYGKTKRDQIGTGYRTNWRYTMAIDSILDPRPASATFGKPICRSDIAGVPGTPFGGAPVADPILAQGCKPLNPFGTGTASPEALAYAFGALTEHNVIRQDVGAASISGKLWEGWGAGPLSAAFGVEYRKDKLSNDAGDLPASLRTDFGLQYGDSFAGSTKVMEGFAEFEMPLLADVALADRLTLNAAIRQAQYKTSGATGGAVGGSNKTDITTWKLASIWDTTDWLRFRGSYSSDIRAPNFRELFYSQTIPAGGFFGSVTNPWINLATEPPGATGSDPTVWSLVGNTELDPEKAKTTTVGMVLSPSGSLEGLQFSVDYFRIKLKGGLALALGGPGAVAACHDTGDPFMCSLLTFGTPSPTQAGNPNARFTNITQMKTVYTNQNPYIAKGLDFAMSYGFAAEQLFGSMPGNFAVSLAATHMIKQEAPVLGAGFVTIQAQLAGQTGGDSGFLSDVAPAPDWTGNVALTYLNGAFSGTYQIRYVAPGHMDLQNPKTGPDSADYNPARSYSVTDNTTGSYFVSNLNLGWELKQLGLERTQVFASINNLFDRDPPFSSGAVGGTNAINFDTLGRSFRFGVRMKF
jgi:outer membrane receptor protein involved in Fe transport